MHSHRRGRTRAVARSIAAAGVRLSWPYAFEPRGHDRRRCTDAEGGVEAPLRSELDEIGRELREASLAHRGPRALVAWLVRGRPCVAGRVSQAELGALGGVIEEHAGVTQG